MKKFILLLLLAITPLSLSKATAEIKPGQVVILYNSNVADSKELALHYAKARQIPGANIIGLNLLDQEEISHDYYNKNIRDPLRKTFSKLNWWIMGHERNGITHPTTCKISTIVCMRGVPYKIKRIPLPPKPKTAPKKIQSKNKPLPTEASVDSELTLLGVSNYPLAGPSQNAYFKKDTPFHKAKLPFIILVGRIDGPDYTICKNMIDDAITVEKQGLWGACYLDFALKAENKNLGDEWLERIATLNHNTGIPTVTDRNKQTLTTNYPMNDCAVYFGWYTQNRNGPLLNPKFSFRKGAIATHLHSFSARHLRDKNKTWSGPILARGAAATLGNVYEPYLPLINQYDIFYDRLLKGYTLIEAAYMSAPALSWQNLVLGDPLYKPFLHIDGSGDITYTDKDYRAIRLANTVWGEDQTTFLNKLNTAAEAADNSIIYEYLGLWHRHQKKNKEAIEYFKKSAATQLQNSDTIRQWLHIADIQRNTGKKQEAIKTLKEAAILAKKSPELLSIKALLNILDPPPPPPVKEPVRDSKSPNTKPH